MIRAAAAALAFALAASASAAEYASVGTAGAVLYDGPSPNATRLFVAPKGMPIELISVIRLWVKVRDVFGDVMWIERGDISPQRTVVTTAVDASVRQHAERRLRDRLPGGPGRHAPTRRSGAGARLGARCGTGTALPATCASGDIWGL